LKSEFRLKERCVSPWDLSRQKLRSALVHLVISWREVFTRRRNKMNTHVPLRKLDPARPVSGSLWLLLAATLITSVAVSAAWCSVTGRISGTVKDSSGSFVTDDSITANNTDTGIELR